MTGRIDPRLFKHEYEVFESAVLRHSGHRFQSIRTGLPGRWENYKLPLRQQALQLLAPNNWTLKDVGSGRILDSVIKAIEIPGTEGNNFVRWHGQWGPETRQHKGILEARRNPSSRRRAEDIFFSLYRDGADEAECFSAAVDEFGKNYSLHAYLFFLMNADAFMPIAPATFDKAFGRLGLTFKTSNNCSWENYLSYNETLQDIKVLLSEMNGFENCRLVDAHSFLWLLIRIEEEAQRKFSSNTGKSTAVVFGPRDKSIFEMVRNAMQAAAQSGKETVRTYKHKEVEEARLRDVVDDLISEQRGLCNITGLPLQFLGDCTDTEMLASLDRIDSNGNYVKHNLQVVCRFINRWKSSGTDDQFRRLIGIVRSADPEE